jgi:hypothetical protein
MIARAAAAPLAESDPCPCRRMSPTSSGYSIDPDCPRHGDRRRNATHLICVTGCPVVPCLACDETRRRNPHPSSEAPL